jgi:crotonobetainyl-CoA:carnitine CoA-transferase CaiB-like acyl-CoA transferase
LPTPANAAAYLQDQREVLVMTAALTGIRVVDLSRVLAGPMCSQILADHGATVVKVEPPSGDDTRTLGPPFNNDGDAAYYSALNRGKDCISVDLAKVEGRKIVEKLLETADILIENFLPGTMEKWGLSYEAVLKERYPRLIYCGISGFGSDGPLGGLPGYDAVLQAICGLMSVNGEKSSGPTRVGVPIVDHMTGYSALTGILLALHERNGSGRGQRVEVTLFDTALSLLVPHAANLLESGNEPGLLGSAHPNISPYDRFKCADGEIFLGIMNRGQFERFCQVVERPDLISDTRFSDNALRIEHRQALRDEIERSLGAMSKSDLCGRLMGKGVPAGPVNSVSEAISQPHAQHRQMVVRREGYQGIGLPVRLMRTPGQPGANPRRFNADARSVLRDAGYSASEVEQLIADAVISRKNVGLD